MRSFLYVLVILFFAISFGFVVAILYYLWSSSLFDENGFGLSRMNEVIYYLLILLPPFIYCWTMYVRLKKVGERRDSAIYLVAGITYLAGGLIFMLIWTGFHVIRC